MAIAKLNTPSVDEVEYVEVEITEEEEHIIDVLFEHPTRDDVHEQRERGQRCEGVIHAHVHITVRR